MKNYFKRAWSLVTLAGLFVHISVSYAAPATEAEAFSAPTSPTTTARHAINPTPPMVELPALQTQRTADRMASKPPIGPLEIGVGRDIPEGFNRLLDAAALSWVADSDGGHVAHLVFKSAGAQAVRAGIKIYHVPEEAELRFYSPATESAQVFLVTGTQINASQARDKAARDADSEAALLYWSPVITGDQIGVQIYLPPGVDPQRFRIAITKLSHLLETMESSANCPFGIGIACSQACGLDAMCFQGVWSEEIAAVAKMVFTTDDGSSAVCSGTLINDLDPNSQIPYFLTARHCISSQTVASTLQTYWGFQTVGCDGLPSKEVRVVTGGASLLSALEDMDMTLLRLNGIPPDGATMVGWDTNPVAAGLPVTGIHHPAGDLKKLSYGYVKGLEYCELPNISVPSFPEGSFFCNPSDLGTFLHVVFQGGATEGGSSGSGIFLNNTHQLIGTLTGGSSSCDNPQGLNVYGRFDLAYERSFRRWLGATGLCSKHPGNWTYCSNQACGPCNVGEGDCDADNECAGGLVCAQDVGPAYGWSPNVDVCERPALVAAASPSCRLLPGDPGYCADPACGPCGLDEGDCDNDSECRDGLVCASDVGAILGLSTSTDVCVAAPAENCSRPNGDWQFCEDPLCGPCAAGRGDCDSDADCQPGLVCAKNVGANYGFPPTMDVCELPQSQTCDKLVDDWDYCSDPACGPCTLGHGDCETDADCATGLVCGFNSGEKYGLPANMDVCEAPVP